MADTELIYFGIAATVSMAVSPMSSTLRLKARTPASRTYLSALVLVALTTCATLVGDVCDLRVKHALSA